MSLHLRAAVVALTETGWQPWAEVPSVPSRLAERKAQIPYRDVAMRVGTAVLRTLREPALGRLRRGPWPAT